GLVGEVRRQAGTRGNPVARHISACVANVDLPEEEERTAAALLAQGWSATAEAVNDTFAVLRAGLDGTATADSEARPGPRRRPRHGGWGARPGAAGAALGRGRHLRRGHQLRRRRPRRADHGLPRPR